MAKLKAEVVKIDSIENHPNADRMELAVIGGYQVCVQYNAFKEGDLAIYIPVDSILTEELESLIFGPDSKVKLHKHRVRAIKLRGAVSQGMLIPGDLVFKYLSKYKAANRVILDEGTDCTEALDITKYEPPEKPMRTLANNRSAKCERHHHPDFRKYTDVNHFRKYWNAFDGMDDVYVTEKLHGTNFRAGWVPFKPRTFLQKLKNILGLNPKWEFVYGSHNVQLMDGKGKYAFENNVYKRIVYTKSLRSKIPYGEVWYGEIIGENIQTNYAYGLKKDVDVYFFDIMQSMTGKYFDFKYVVNMTDYLHLKVVPWKRIAYDRGHIVTLLNHEEVVSEIDQKTRPIEGFVVRPIKEQMFYGGRLILKLLSDAYLLNKDNSDFH